MTPAERERYFAYASNMDPSVMREHCPHHRYLGAARLDHHRLAFTRRSLRSGTGVADVVGARGSTVWGALYELCAEDVRALDVKEGSGWAYARRVVRVHMADGRESDAFTYAVIDKEPREVTPSGEYLRCVLEASRRRGLPEQYVRALAAAWGSAA